MCCSCDITPLVTLLQTGIDRAEVKRDERKAEKQDATTLATALAEYVKGKRRGKDGLALKERTKADYMAMLAAGGTKKNGKPYLDGPLHTLAQTPLTKITADQIRKVYADTLKRSQRTATYAMQVLRAVMNWHGIAIENSPLSKDTAGKKRIVIVPTKGNPKPIPPERLGAWWRAATTRSGNAAADGCRMILLTGCRPGEIFGNQGTDADDKHTVFTEGLRVGDVDLIGGRVVLIDTKNRKDHTIALSTQALEIVQMHCEGKSPDAKVFDAIYPSKAISAINADAGVTGITPHKLRHTFASVAEELVSGYALKRMLNHADDSDVTGTNYIGKSETQLREAWQKVADFIQNAS